MLRGNKKKVIHDAAGPVSKQKAVQSPRVVSTLKKAFSCGDEG
jgi:hypothetical protein